ncbi:MAG: RNA methyltransferase [Bacteroidia bacterium]|nr:RNA methyltransferase [Bacteroidia bacterium]MDW8159045.1 RNA methyltransferase [Bacteroidia bacterium]
MKQLQLEELGRLSVEEYKKQPKKEIVVILENVRSGHNVGTVFRTADAFLIEKIILTGFTPIPPHVEIQKTALGATEAVAWEYHADILAYIESIKQQGYIIIAVEQTDRSILLPTIKTPPKKWALIFGHEVTGISQATLEVCDFAIEIPQYGTKHSLNISVAAGIVLYTLTHL